MARQMLEIPLKMCGHKFKMRAFCMIVCLAAPEQEQSRWRIGLKHGLRFATEYNRGTEWQEAEIRWKGVIMIINNGTQAR